jgi:hypothetical protein
MRIHIHVCLASGLAMVTGAACSAAPPEGDATTASESLAMHDGKDGKEGAILPRLPATPTFSDSTIPDNGDVNPYGVAFVPKGFPSGGLLRPGDVIVANFNNSANLQGTGTTIVRVNNNASPSLFFPDDSAPGFSTALGVLKRGFVLVGHVPSTDGSGSCTQQGDQMLNVGAGALLVIDRFGNLVKTLENDEFLDGPWDLTVVDEGHKAKVFVSNVLSGTVTRLDLRVGEDDVKVERKTQIASGYLHRCDMGAFVVGPTGLALDPDRDVLYVAATGDNKIFAVHDASDRRSDRGPGKVVVDDPVHLHGPLGLARALNGNLISAQGDAVNPDPNQPSEIVEFTAKGRFVAQFSIDQTPGSAFGLALEEKSPKRFRFAAVDDGLNVLDIWNVRSERDDDDD